MTSQIIMMVNPIVYLFVSAYGAIPSDVYPDPSCDGTPADGQHAVDGSLVGEGSACVHAIAHVCLLVHDIVLQELPHGRPPTSY